MKRVSCQYNYSWYLFRRRNAAAPFATFPLRLYSQPQSVSTSTNDCKAFCVSSADHPIGQGLFSSTQLDILPIISACSSIVELCSAIDFAALRRMKLTSTSYAALIRKLVDFGEYQEAAALFNDCLTSRGIEPNSLVLNSMVITYCRLGQPEEAKSHFDRLFELKFTPCEDVCNSIIQCLGDNGRILDAFDCFASISEAGILSSLLTCNRLIGGLCFRGYLDEALHVYDIMCDRGVPPTVYLFKSLICGLCERGRLVEAELLSTEMECHGLFLDKLMYNAIINVCCKNKKIKTALRVFFRMLKMGCDPNSCTYNTLIHGFVNSGLIDKAWMLLNQMEKSGIKPDMITYHIMINKYCKDHAVDCALKLLDFMCERDISPTVTFYTVIITELSKKNRLLEVDELLTKMLNHGVVPDDVLFFQLIDKYGKNNELQLALIFLRAIAKNGCQIKFSTSATDDSNADIELEIEYLLEKIVESCLSLSDIAFSIYLIALCWWKD